MRTSPEAQIVEHILDAIADQKLQAGTKLGEESLGEIFSCNRTQVRRALATLTGYHVVEHVPNKGAFVATPSQADAGHVFEARRAIETMICKNVVQMAKTADLDRLSAHLEQEVKANAGGDRATAIRLSREFHLILSEVGGNPVLAQYLEELTMRTSLILGLYGNAQHSLCNADEHSGIVAAIKAGDEATACALLEEHLRHIESGVDFDGPPKVRSALSALIGPVGD